MRPALGRVFFCNGFDLRAIFGGISLIFYDVFNIFYLIYA